MHLSSGFHSDIRIFCSGFQWSWKVVSYPVSKPKSLAKTVSPVEALSSVCRGAESLLFKDHRPDWTQTLSGMYPSRGSLRRGQPLGVSDRRCASLPLFLFTGRQDPHGEGALPPSSSSAPRDRKLWGHHTRAKSLEAQAPGVGLGVLGRGGVCVYRFLPSPGQAAGQAAQAQ